MELRGNATHVKIGETMSDDLNKLAGGKPFYDLSVIDDDKHKPDYHEKDIEGYDGKWCVWVVTVSGKQGANTTTHDFKEQSEQEIKDIRSGKIMLLDANKVEIPISFILSMFPMPKA